MTARRTNLGLRGCDRVLGLAAAVADQRLFLIETVDIEAAAIRNGAAMTCVPVEVHAGADLDLALAVGASTGSPLGLSR